MARRVTLTIIGLIKSPCQWKSPGTPILLVGRPAPKSIGGNASHRSCSVTIQPDPMRFGALERRRKDTAPHIRIGIA